MTVDSHVPERLARAAISELKDRLLAEFPRLIVSIVFFGSRKSGRFTPDSDIDVLVVVTEKTREVADRIFQLADDVERDLLLYTLTFSLHIRGVTEHDESLARKSRFLTEVQREGEIIYARETVS
jgi:predicted nucleotidyltransferase